MNVEFPNVMRISRQSSPAQITIEQEQPENMNRLCGLIINDARRTREIKSTIAMAKAAFNRKTTLFTSKFYFSLRKKLAQCYIWNIASRGAGTWTLLKVDQKCVGSFEMWCWRRMEKISWTDRVRNEEVLQRVKEERNLLHSVQRKKGELDSLHLA